MARVALLSILASLLGCGGAPPTESPSPATAHASPVTSPSLLQGAVADVGVKADEIELRATAPVKVLDTSSVSDVRSCRAAGTVPASYYASAVDPDGHDLSRGWRLKRGEVKRGGRLDLDDSDWESVDVPGHWLTARESRRLVYWLRQRFEVAEEDLSSGLALELGGRIGRTEVWLNGERLLKAEGQPHAPIVIPPKALPLRAGENLLAVKVITSKAAAGLWWYGDVRLGRPTQRQRGLVYRTFVSEIDGSKQQLALYLPKCADLSNPMPLVVALPGWNGNVHVFSPTGFVTQAEALNMLLLVPDPRGNRLYTGESEQGVLEALALVQRDFKIDPDRISITGVSMGGAGATQIGYHYPDRFASVVSIHGDSLYDLGTYVGKILKTQQRADRYSVLRFAANARNLPVLLIHAHDDPVSDVKQSLLLANASKALKLEHHQLLDPQTGGHSLAFVHDVADEAMAFMGRFKRVKAPERVSFRSNAAAYASAYWVELELRSEGRFGTVDVSLKGDLLTVHDLSRGVKQLWLRGDHPPLLAFSPLTLRLEKPTDGLLGFTAMEGVSALEVQPASGEPLLLQVVDGRVQLPIAPGGVGDWTLRWVR